MKNKSVSDWVAATMDAALKSEAHQALFGTTYKFANHECEKCHHMHEGDSCGDDTAMAQDFTVSEMEDSNHASDGSSDEEDVSNASDGSSDEEEMTSSAFDVAIDSLLTASAALDSLDLQKGSVLSLKLASLVVEAKKKDEKDKKSSKTSKTSKDSKKDSKKSDPKKDSKKSDSNAAKDKGKKKEESSKSSSKSSSSSSSKSSDKKPFGGKKPPFAKKK